MRRAGGGPGGAGARTGGGGDDLPAAVRRKDEVPGAEATVSSGRSALQAAEKRGEIRPDVVTWATIAPACAGLARVAGLMATAASGACRCTWPIGFGGEQPELHGLSRARYGTRLACG